MRDPDGYYIEFCNCETLHSFLTQVELKHSSQPLSIEGAVMVSKYAKVSAFQETMFLKKTICQKIIFSGASKDGQKSQREGYGQSKQGQEGKGFQKFATMNGRAQPFSK